MVFTNPDWFWNNILGVWKGGVSWDFMIFFREIFPLFLVILCLYHSGKTFGWWKTILFFYWILSFYRHRRKCLDIDRTFFWPRNLLFQRHSILSLVFHGPYQRMLWMVFHCL